jgi:hypothetical protein
MLLLMKEELCGGEVKEGQIFRLSVSRSRFFLKSFGQETGMSFGSTRSTKMPPNEMHLILV